MIGFKQWNICQVPGKVKVVPCWSYIELTTRTFVFKDFVEST